MKKFAAIFTVLTLVALSGALACDKEKSEQSAKAAPAGQGVKEVVLVGYVTDSNCGGAHAKSCPMDCLKKGAKLQLRSEAKVYTLEKVESPETHFGHQVKVTGLLDEGSGIIQVASIETVSKKS